MKNKKGETMAFLTLDDRTGRIEVSVFAKVFQSMRDVLVKDAIVLVEGVVRRDDYTGGLAIRANSVQSLVQARREKAIGIRLELHSYELDPLFIKQLQALLRGQIDGHGGGDCKLEIHYTGRGATSVVRLGSDWRVQPSEDLLRGMRELCGEAKVSVIYRDGAAAGLQAQRPAATH